MDPWRPKYKPLFDALEMALQAVQLATLVAVLWATIILTI